MELLPAQSRHEAIKRDIFDTALNSPQNFYCTLLFAIMDRQKLSPEEAAEKMFRPGLMTAEQLDQLEPLFLNERLKGDAYWLK